MRNSRLKITFYGEFFEYKYIKELYAYEQKNYPTGFDKLDQKIGGFYPGELIVVAGRPLMGKTTFALTLAQRMSNDHNINIAYFSLQMDREQVLQRVKHIYNVQKDINENKNIFHVDDTPGISVAQLKQKCIEHQKEQNIDIVFIDYLQLMSGDNKCESRIQEVNYVANGLKELWKTGELGYDIKGFPGYVLSREVSEKEFPDIMIQGSNDTKYYSLRFG